MVERKDSKPPLVAEWSGISLVVCYRCHAGIQAGHPTRHQWSEGNQPVPVA